MPDQQRPVGPRASFAAAMRAEWVLIVVLVLALAMTLFTVAVLALAGSVELRAGKLIGGDAPLRNLLEVTYFICQCVLVVVALSALPFARRQAQEAKNARLASIYGQIEARWSSEGMMRSRVKVAELVAAYRASAQAEPGLTLPGFIHAELQAMSLREPAKYATVMSVVDYLEYIGMMEERGYLDLADIAGLMGELCIYAHDLMNDHLAELRVQHRMQAEGLNYPGMPEVYRSFTALAGRFAAEFRTPPGR